MSETNPLRVFVGFDDREAEAYRVAVASLRKRARAPVCVVPLMLGRNEQWGLLARPWRIWRGQMWDIVSDAPQSTQFATSRFLTPHLAQTGWVLFTDCDVVFLGDVYELLELVDPSKAVMVVKHDDYRPVEDVKMDGQAQQRYPRKNWSSVVLWNADHEAHRRLTLNMLNTTPGRDLHAFAWLRDHEIGELPRAWNWLVNVQPRPEAPRLAHFTLGGPWLPHWQSRPYDDIWMEAARES